MVGVVNTVFGYGSFALLTVTLAHLIPNSYILAGFLSGLLNVTFAYLNYKWIVFKTKGNYFREWLRCVTVYGASMAVGTLLLPVIVVLIHRFTSIGAGAPYVAGAILTAWTAVSGFLGHKKFSFQPIPDGPAPSGRPASSPIEVSK
ncbi:MAG TPA: GtrA family protein [Candidatus Angelobacter sp.]|nr:GtrA family protein [Candidatus Angelobacter sp.]